MMRPTTLPASLWICCGLSIALTAVGLGLLRDWELEKFVVVFALQLAVYGYAAWQLFRGSWRQAAAERHLLIVILLVAAVLRAAALFAPQALSTDAYRYVWDGRVQAAGINPYRFIPADPSRSIRTSIGRTTRTRFIRPPRNSPSSPSSARATA
jgi:alpha-1,6-mannosyltransferase